MMTNHPPIDHYAPSGDATMPAHPRPTILVVDDNPTNLELFHLTLRNKDYRVLVAEDGRSGYERAEKALPDLILLDVMMPGMDGFETCRRLKENVLTKEIPVVFLSAVADKQERSHGGAAGGCEFLEKPVRPSTLLAAVERNLRPVRNAADKMAESESGAHWMDAITHDIRGQLSIAEGFLELLKEDVTDAEQDGAGTEYCTIIHSAHEAIKRILDALITSRSIQQVRLNIAAFDLRDMLRRCADALEIQPALFLEDEQDRKEITIISDAVLFESWLQTVLAVLLTLRESQVKEPLRLALDTAAEASIVRLRITVKGRELNDHERQALYHPEIVPGKQRVSGVGVGLVGAAKIMQRLHIAALVRPSEGGSLHVFTIPLRIETD
jgi:CheY-like chemotaxis protein